MEIIIKFPNLSLIFQKHIVKFRDHGDSPTTPGQLKKSVTQTLFESIKDPQNSIIGIKFGLKIVI